MIRLAVTARCLHCPWTAGPGGWDVDRQAERHTKAGHPTATIAGPKTSAAPAAAAQKGTTA